MDTLGTKNADWTAEMNESSETVSHQATRNRKDKWYEDLGLNIKEITHNLPLIVKSYSRESRDSEGNMVSMRIWPMVFKRITRIRERYPVLFSTNSDILRAIVVIGLDILEEVFINHGPDNPKENEIFGISGMMSQLLEDESTSMMLIYTMRRISQNYTADTMDKEEFMEKINKIVESAPPEVKVRIGKTVLALIDEHGFKEDKIRLQAKLRMRKYREKRTHQKSEEIEEI